MSVIEQAAELLRRMDRPEKVRLLSMLASDPSLHPSAISITPGVCGGSPCVRGMRLPVWLLESLRRDGATDAELLSKYPDLTENDLRDVWAFVEQNRELVDQEIHHNAEAA